MAKSSIMQQYARIGALARLNELRAEIAEIERAFPGVGNTGRRGRGGRLSAGAADSGADAGGARRRRTRKPMTAAQKRAVGLRMKKYWAARRKAAGK